ncbi:transposase [Lysinibacillus xylanilyticus]|uniref:transposase n=1 Tax=Lysinibacillus xylanilyticus TaxID=582475 RepID=UPI003817D714
MVQSIRNLRGKGDKEREVYFNTRCDKWLKRYIESRTDNNPAIFVTVRQPHKMSVAQMRYIIKRISNHAEINKEIHPHQRLMLKTILTHIDFLSEQIELLNLEVATRLSSHQEDIERLDSIPGIATRMAEQILAEVGTDVEKQFPIAAHLCSWAGLVPGHKRVLVKGNQLT